MCVLALWVDLDPERPLVVAANRDESYARPSAPPREIEPGIFAGQDQKSGGTWLGWNAHGLVVGITNRRSPAPGPGSPSRGGLVLEALRCRKLACVAGLVERRSKEHPYAGFSLVAVSGSEGRAFHFDGAFRTVGFGRGVHVLSSDRDLDDPEMPEKAVVDRLGEGVPGLAELGRFLGSHEGTRPICKHGPDFGTVSSTILVRGRDGIEHYFAEGAPCRTDFALVRRSLISTGESASRRP